MTTRTVAVVVDAHSAGILAGVVEVLVARGRAVVGARVDVADRHSAVACRVLAARKLACLMLAPPCPKTGRGHAPARYACVGRTYPHCYFTQATGHAPLEALSCCVRAGSQRKCRHLGCKSGHPDMAAVQAWLQHL